MIWLEVRSTESRFDSGWNIGESVWAPTEKRDGAQWPFWNLVNEVQKDDIIIHLTKVGGNFCFSGYSLALSGAYITTSRPTQQNFDWDFAETFYKVDLYNYRFINPVVELKSFFDSNEVELRSYFRNNESLEIKKRLFFVPQSGRLQCLNGAYFSEFDEVLIDLLVANLESESRIETSTNTSERLANFNVRIGHHQFSENVKRNFKYQCCFPGCEIKGRGYLVSGHIARWSDNPELRGLTENGLCLCLIHDKAFEKGHIIIDSSLNIRVIDSNIGDNAWLSNFLATGNNKPIKESSILPSLESLSEHWTRIGFNVDS